MATHPQILTDPPLTATTQGSLSTAIGTSTTGAPTSTARSNLGPLTTTWTAPSFCNQGWLACSGCDHAWQGQACNGDGSNNDALACWPPIATSLSAAVAAPFFGLGFYSPGIACPAGYTTACAMQGGPNGLPTAISGTQQFNFQYSLTQSETAIGCCPTGYTCASNAGAQTCSTLYASTAETVLSCSSGANTITTVVNVPETVTTTSSSSVGPSVVSEFTIWAALYQLNYRATDLPSSSSSSSSSTTSISSSPTTSSTAPQQTTSSSAGNGGSNSNSNTTTIVVAVVVPCVVVAILAALGWFWYRRRQTRKQNDYKTTGEPGRPAAELSAQDALVEMSAAQGRFEMPSDSVTVRRPGPKGIVHELDAS